MDLSRRCILHLASVGIGMGVAGCSETESPTPSSTNTESSDQPSTESTTSSPTQSVQVTFSAEVIRQATTENPAQLRARLDNQGSKTVQVGFGPALLFSDDTTSDELEWADKLVIDPATNVGPWDDPTHSAEGCWRFPEDGSRLIQSTLSWRDLSPSDPLTETYEVYTYGTSGPCLPEGTYRFQDKVSFADDTPAQILTLSLQIDADQQLTVNAEETGAFSD